MPETTDPNASGNPNPGAEQDASPGDGEPGAPAEKPSGQTVAQVAERNLQGLVDRDLGHLDKGEFGKMNPKTVQLLTKYHEMMTGSQQQDPQAEPFRPAQSYTEPQADPNAADAALGRETRSKQMLGEIHETVAQNFMAEEWAEDVKAFMALVGDKEITDEVWATVDFTDPRKFPRTRQGYRTWKTNVMKATAQLLGSAPPKEGEGEPNPVDADRAAAGQTNRPPAPKGGTGTGFKNAVEVARAFRARKISKAQAKEELAKFRTVH